MILTRRWFIVTRQLPHIRLNWTFLFKVVNKIFQYFFFLFRQVFVFGHIVNSFLKNFLKLPKLSSSLLVVNLMLMLFFNISIPSINTSRIDCIGIIVNYKKGTIPKIWDLYPIEDWRIACWLITLLIALWCSLIMVFLSYLSIIISKIKNCWIC